MLSPVTNEEQGHCLADELMTLVADMQARELTALAVLSEREPVPEANGSPLPVGP